MYQISIPVFIHSLTALSAVIDKGIADAAARKYDESVIFNFALAPDMLSFQRQVRNTTNFANGCAARLAGVEIPALGEAETTLEQLKERIARSIAFLKSLTPAQVDGAEDRDITLPMGGTPMTFKGLHYFHRIALPQFYFHYTTAYDILRHLGVN